MNDFVSGAIVDGSMKTCAKCLQQRPLKDFRAVKEPSGEITSTRASCRDCDAAGAAAYRSRKLEKMRAKWASTLSELTGNGEPIGKRCVACTQQLPLAAFGRNKKNSDGRSKRCRECNYKYSRNARARRAQKNQVSGLSDKYVKRLLVRSEKRSYLKRVDIPGDMVDAKRAQINLQRQCKRNFL